MISLESCLFYNECYIGYIFFESFAPIKGGKTKILKKSKNHYIQPKATSAHQYHDYWMFTWGVYVDGDNEICNFRLFSDSEPFTPPN